MKNFIMLLYFMILFLLAATTSGQQNQTVTPQTKTTNFPSTTPSQQTAKQKHSKSSLDKLCSSKMPKSTVEIESDKWSLYNKHALDIALKGLDNTIRFFSIFMSVVIFFFGAGLTYIQISQGKKTENQMENNEKRLKDRLDLSEKISNIENKIETWKTDLTEKINKERLDEKFNLQQKIIDVERQNGIWKSKIDKEITKDLSKIPQEVEEKVEALFNSRYRDEIFRNTQAFTQEVIMSSPDARGLLVSRLRSMDTQMKRILTKTIGEKDAKQISDIIKQAIEDWHTLGQLFSPDINQVQMGLLSVKGNPFAEARERLELLEKRYIDDPTLFPLINDAIREVEKI